jgi:anaerobic magnesium-protoporphyrin IX monomethyl ester cyclase
MPHLALPTLTAYLRRKGFTVLQRDLNAEVYDFFLSRPALEGALGRLRQDYGHDGLRRPARRALPDSQAVQWALTNGPDLIQKVEQAKQVFKSEAFYDGAASREAFLTLNQSLVLASLPFYPSNLDFNGFTSAHPVDSSSSLLQAVRDPAFNPFLEFFRNGVLKDIEREQPDIVGISIPTQGSFLAGMTVAYLVKKAGLKCHVTVGGPHITMLREQLPRAPMVFSLIDSAAVGAGEVALLRLGQAIENSAGGQPDFSQVPNLIYREDGVAQRPSIHVNEPDHTFDHRNGGRGLHEDEPQDELPDFDGLNFEHYLAPERVLPLMTAHGCYHGKCAFCNVGYGWDNSYRQLQAERIVGQMLALHEKYGTRHIFFADEAITPKNMRLMSQLLAEHNSPVNWCTCARLEKTLSKELLASLEKGGCRMLLFGLETASVPIVELMDKGTQVETMSRVLQESAEVGIWNHTFFFFGFPGETIEDAQETVNFLYANQTAVHSASPGTFLLERYAPAHLYPDKFNIKRIIEKPDKDLAIYFDFELKSGMNEEMAERVVESLMSVLPQKPFGQYYITDVYKLLYSSHLHERGVRFPPWLVPEEVK